jgi:hypothetical protein
VKDLLVLERSDRGGAVTEHLGESGVGQQDDAVLRDRQDGDRKTLQHHQCGKFFEERNRCLPLLAVSSPLHAHNYRR